ncbi:MAG: hypothetical protein QM687_02980 [Ferruginibacter sp.]
MNFSTGIKTNRLDHKLHIWLLIMIISFGGCDNKPSVINEEYKKKQLIANFIKERFRIKVDTGMLTHDYIKRLEEEKKNLNPDSIFYEQIEITDYKPAGFSFVRYFNPFVGRDSIRHSNVAVDLLYDHNSGQCFVDNLIYEWGCNLLACYKTGLMKIDASIASQSLCNMFNRISTSRMFGEHETMFEYESSGFQDYFNSVHLYKIPDTSFMNNLFSFYELCHPYARTTLLKTPENTLEYMAKQDAKIRSEPDYENRSKNLIYLKDQISLLLMKMNAQSEKYFIWVYETPSNLKIREMRIYGSEEATFRYNIREYKLCF